MFTINISVHKDFLSINTISLLMLHTSVILFSCYIKCSSSLTINKGWVIEVQSFYQTIRLVPDNWL